MAQIKLVAKYLVRWYPDKKEGMIALFPQDENTAMATMTFDNASDLAAIAEILRNEKPIYWNTISKMITTLWEEVGEEET